MRSLFYKLSLISAIISAPAMADIKPAQLFVDHMVIQRDTQAPFGAKQNLVKRFMLQVVGALMLKRELV